MNASRSFRAFLVFLCLWSISVSNAFALPVSPSGEKISADIQGNAIYRVKANDIEIGYKLIGSGEPLLLIMGLGGTMDRWPQEVVDALAERFQLILFDNRGMGFTTANETPFSYELFAGDVIGLLDALHVETTHVLGYSMGSTITQELLLKYPQRIRKAIVHATSIDGSHVADALKGKTPDNPTVLRQIEATTHWKTPLDKLPFITNHILLVVGTSDDIVGVESSKTIATNVPGAWFVQFGNATHALMHETPVDFAKIVLAFLEIEETIRK